MSFCQCVEPPSYYFDVPRDNAFHLLTWNAGLAKTSELRVRWARRVVPDRGRTAVNPARERPKNQKIVLTHLTEFR
jgi:hypothetical protein